MNHAVHHLTDAETVAEVVKGVVPVVLLNRQLRDRDLAIRPRKRARPRAPPSLGCYQPAFERDGVHVELLHQAQVVVHVLQAAQHLQPQRKEAMNVSRRAVWDTSVCQHTSLCSQCQTSNVGFLRASTVS